MQGTETPTQAYYDLIKEYPELEGCSKVNITQEQADKTRAFMRGLEEIEPIIEEWVEVWAKRDRAAGI